MDADWADGGQQEVVLGCCEDMCPVEERKKRLDEADVHKLELPYAAVQNGHESEFQATMIKKFQRSSADHDLLIASMLRTPTVLLRTISYIESQVANKYHEGVDARFNEAPSKLFVYLFIWDRYRMVAKDFTLQFGALPLTEIWIECHERMARWFIFMDHSMKSEDDYLGGHAQQNGEQLNNVLKTLQTYYSKVSNTSVRKGNEAEFIAYFILFQIENPGEVTKFLQKLSTTLLRKAEIQFAIKVWVSIRTENYVQFFHLLAKSANILQASLMHRYVDSVRYKALKKLLKSLCLGSKTYNFSTEELAKLMLFESTEETIAFVEHCGLKTVDNGEFILFESVNLDSLLPRDKNELPIYPKTKHMEHNVHGKAVLRNQGGKMMHIMDICRGSATNSIILPEFVPAGSTPAKLLNKKDLMKRMSDKIAREKNQVTDSNTAVAAEPTPVTSSTATKLSATASEFIPSAGFKASVQLKPSVAATPAAAPNTVVFPPPAPVAAKPAFNAKSKDIPSTNPFAASQAATSGFAFGSNAAAKPFASTPTVSMQDPFSANTKASSFSAAPPMPAPASNVATPASSSSMFGITNVFGNDTDGNLAKSNLDFLNKKKESQIPSKMKLPDTLLPTRESPRMSPRNSNINSKDWQGTSIKPTNIFETPAAFKTQPSAESIDTISKYRDAAAPRNVGKSSPVTSNALFGADTVKKATPVQKQKETHTPGSASRVMRQESYDAISAHFPEKVDDARVKELTKQVKQRYKRRVLLNVFRFWNSKYHENKKKVEDFVLKRTFRAWLRVMRISNQARDSFLESVSSIQIIPPDDEEEDKQEEESYFGSSGRGANQGNNRRLSKGRSPHSSSKRPPIRAYSARSLQAQHGRDGDIASNSLQGAYFLSSSSPHHSLAKLGFSLFQLQTQRLRQLSHLLPIPETVYTCLPIEDNQQAIITNRILSTFAGPVTDKRKNTNEYWQGDIYLKVALCGVNCASEGGLFINQTDCPISAMMRSSLLNEQGYFQNFNYARSKLSEIENQKKDLAEVLSFDEKAFLLQAYQTVGSSNSFAGEPLVESPHAFLLSKASHSLINNHLMRMSVVDIPGIASFHEESSAANFDLVDGSQGLVMLFSNFHENFLNFPVDLKAIEAALQQDKPVVFVFSVFHDDFVVSKDNIIQEWVGLPSSQSRQEVLLPIVSEIIDQIMKSLHSKLGDRLTVLLNNVIAKTFVLHASCHDGFIRKKVNVDSWSVADNVVRIPLPIFELQHSMYLQAAVQCMDSALTWLTKRVEPIPIVEGRHLLPFLREKIISKSFDTALPSMDKVKISLANVSFWLFSQYLTQTKDRMECLRHELQVKHTDLLSNVKAVATFPAQEWILSKDQQTRAGVEHMLFKEDDEQFYGFLPANWRDGKGLTDCQQILQQALQLLQGVQDKIPNVNEPLTSKLILQLCQQIDAIVEKAVPIATKSKRKHQESDDNCSFSSLHGLMTSLFDFYASRLHQDLVFAMDNSIFEHICSNMLTVMQRVLLSWVQRILESKQLSGEEMCFALFRDEEDWSTVLRQRSQLAKKSTSSEITWPTLENIDTSNKPRGGLQTKPLLYADVVRLGSHKRAQEQSRIDEKPVKRVKKSSNESIALEQENKKSVEQQQEDKAQHQSELQKLMESIRQEKTASQKMLNFLHKKIMQ